MKNNKFFMAAIIGTVVSFILGGLIYGLALDSFMRANSGLSPEGMAMVWKPMEQMNWLAMILSTLAGGFLLATILMWGNFTSAASGAKAGAIIGLLICASYDFGFLAMTNMFTMTSAITDMVAGTVMYAITGAVIGMILGKGTSTPATA